MESKIFSIGDVVALKIHPYQNNLTDIIISGDHIMLPPLMVVTEVFKTKQTILGTLGPIDTFKYKCTWFSPKQYKFIDIDAFETDLKLIALSTVDINKVTLKRGDRITLKSAPYELGKKKSSLTYEDNAVNLGNGNTVINSFLSFLPPIMQVLDAKEHKSTNPIVDKKTSKTVREVHGWDIKFSLFDPTTDRIAEYSLPLEAVELVEDVDEIKLSLLQGTINKSGYLAISSVKGISLVKPRHIANRSGYYYLRAYDYITNKVEEIEITQRTAVRPIKNPFKTQVPEFDIAHKPKSATPQFIMNEIILAVKKAKKSNTFIRIKYKNRNEQLSHRTLKDFTIITVKEDRRDVSYLVGYCLLRQAERNFRIDRVQSLQELKMKVV
ncbi:WYL domain-containing protein [Pedobacter sp. CFBP9032]|uniref:WYL domain-containing protein n=1 Tax=Pedobacter sp. CFBP9032 TaxID=3096539 RepID=UPI002A6A0119|nr:WYL domain-containing protein [Pedobacter sp. CFBP9032]MDY0904253.1 WYL domain-containing protein [Pedobacter sp. CFBP9032]